MSEETPPDANDLGLDQFNENNDADTSASNRVTMAPDDDRTAQDLEAVFDVPVTVSAILGRSLMDVSELLSMDEGSIIPLDRKVGEAIDIYVNNRHIARGEVVMTEGRLGVTMTEIIKSES
ncbi:MAG: flagellar motor switch protein FliN [Hyphomicrobiales bacterium]|nr:MAG: flagellar motor switch protein FliN [Hyphomicrobiales bacterium]